VIRVAVYNWIIGKYWWFAFAFGSNKMKDHATVMWNKAQAKKVQWMAEECKRSGWYGYNVTIDGEKGVVMYVQDKRGNDQLCSNEQQRLISEVEK